MRARLALVVTVLGICTAVAQTSQLRAQTAVLSGVVVRDSAGHEIPGAQLALPGLNRSTDANYRGEFKFERLPAGRHVLVIRHIGFAQLHDTITVAEGAHIDREFILTEQATQLDSVRVTAPERKYISPGLSDFEERRKAGFGHFITEEELRKSDDHLLLDVLLTHIPGIKSFFLSKKTSAQYISSGRKCGSGPTLMTCKGLSACPVTLYIDGALAYTASETSISPPDMREFDIRTFAAVEFYAGGATTPARYNATSSDCGVLLLWTRER